MTHCQLCDIVYERRECPLCVLREHDNEVHDFIESKGRPLVRELVAYLQQRETPKETGSPAQQSASPTNKPIMPVCQHCNGTGYLSPNGTSVAAGEHCPGWRYCTCRSGKPA